MPRTQSEYLTQERLHDLVAYNPHTGELTWKSNRSRLAKAGDLAGTVNHGGVVMVGLDGRMYTAARLCWFHVNGEWPESRLRFRDGDQQNLKLANLVPEDKLIRDPTPASIYQRQWRRDRREVEKAIRADPYYYGLVLQQQARGDTKAVRATYKEVLDNIRDDRARFSRGAQSQARLRRR